MAPTVQTFVNSFNNKLEAPLRHHLKNVYGCVSVSLLTASVGAYVHMYTAFLQAGILSSLAAIGLVFALMGTPDNGKNRHLRFGYLTGFAFCTGLGLGPLLDFVVRVDPSIIVSALVGTTIVFVSFSISSLLSERGRWLYLGGSLISMLNIMVLFSLVNFFLGSSFIFQAQLYLGLFVMCGFVIYDTQVIMEKHRMGSKDYIGHSLELFIDFVSIFRHLITILAQKEQTKSSKRKSSE